MQESLDAPRVIANVASTVDNARRQGVPIVWVQHFDDDFPRGSEAWQLVPELSPKAGEPVIHKQFNSAFEQTALEDELAKRQATHVVLSGAQTNWCIRATAYGALERGYDVTLISDAHTTSNINLEDGTTIEAANLIRDLNIAMTWLRYPGRSCSTAKAETMDFGTSQGN